MDSHLRGNQGLGISKSFRPGKAFFSSLPGPGNTEKGLQGVEPNPEMMIKPINEKS